MTCGFSPDVSIWTHPGSGSRETIWTGGWIPETSSSSSKTWIELVWCVALSSPVPFWFELEEEHTFPLLILVIRVDLGFMLRFYFFFPLEPVVETDKRGLKFFTVNLVTRLASVVAYFATVQKMNN